MAIKNFGKQSLEALANYTGMVNIRVKNIDSDHKKSIKRYNYSGFSAFNPERS